MSGAAVEIGVHHGRLFILLHLAVAPAKTVAIDVFDDVALNTDRSGQGDRARFVENLNRCGGDLRRVDIWQISSLDVKPEALAERAGEVALFSVDGGHTAECAYNDLKLADAVLSEHGVVILDDFFNEYWPEVCIGATRYFNDPTSRLRPFAITPGKMYLCYPERSTFFREGMRARFDKWFYDKEPTIFGCPVQIMGIGQLNRTRVDKLRYLTRTSPFGPLLRHVRDATRPKTRA